jgi:precorrin-2 dehydrogenase/sirohydrochlorin ferrochelatase
MFVSLRERVCLVVGGGSVGERKVKGLIRSQATVRLVAQDLTPWLEAECNEESHVTFLGKSYRESHLDEADLVFAATSDPVLNRKIASDARVRGLWCNMATDPEVGSFIVPSVVERGPLTIAISTAGLSPAVAKLVREKLDEQFGADWIAYLELMGRLRTEIQSKGLDSSENQDLFRKIARLPLREWIESGRKDMALGAIHDICQPWLGPDELNRIWDEIWKPFS